MKIKDNSQVTLVFGCDHAGYALKEHLKQTAKNWDYSVEDCGTHSQESVDYPDFIPAVVAHVKQGHIGILTCGSGIGMSIGANRFQGIRGALCHNVATAQLARAHNDANILVLGENIVTFEEAANCLEAFLKTPFEGERHLRRIQKLETYPLC